MKQLINMHLGFNCSHLAEFEPARYSIISARNKKTLTRDKKLQSQQRVTNGKSRSRVRQMDGFKTADCFTIVKFLVLYVPSQIKFCSFQLRTDLPTHSFIILETQNLSIGKLYVVWNCRSTDYEILKLRQDRST